MSNQETLCPDSPAIETEFSSRLPVRRTVGGGVALRGVDATIREARVSTPASDYPPALTTILSPPNGAVF